MDAENKKLLKAARSGDWAEISKLLDDGIDIDKTLEFEYAFNTMCDENTVTVLSEASKHGHLECVQKLIEMGAGEKEEIFNVCCYKLALDMAGIHGHRDCFQFLAENRLFKTIGDRQKYQFFIDTSRRKDFDQIQKILSVQVDGDILNGWKGNNLMSLFVMNGCPPSCLQRLIDLGVNVNGVDYNGYTPLMCAVLTENITLVRFLLCLGANINSSSYHNPSYFLPNGTTALKPDEGDTALIYAACFRNNEILSEMLKFCLKNEVDINFCQNNLKWSAVTYAAYFGNRDSVSLLLNSGADLGSPDWIFYLTIHHLAILRHHPVVLELTLKADKDPFPDLYQWEDILVSDADCLDVLLRHINNTCDSSAITGHYICLLWAAAEGNRLDSVRICLNCWSQPLLNHKGVLGKTLIMFLGDDHVEILDFLIKAGANVHSQDNDGNTAVMHLAKANAVKCLETVISHGANIHVRNKKGQTALMMACAGGHVKCVECLIKSDVSVTPCEQNKHKQERQHSEIVCEKWYYINAQDEEGRTAVMYAAEQDKSECLFLLINEGADLDLTDKKEGTVFSIAMSHRGNCVIILLHCGKLLCDGVLKPEHRHAMCVMPAIREFSVICVMSAMKFGIFDWNWCTLTLSLSSIIFSAVKSGYGPGKIKYKGTEISPLHLAFIRSDLDSVMFLLAHRYFFAEDLKNLPTEDVIVESSTEDHHENIMLVLHALNNTPLNLQTLSFLTISKTVSLAKSPSDRRSTVDALPLPTKLKKSLKFETNINSLGHRYWRPLEIGEVFDSLNFRQELTDG